jgi:hypothetical protein
MVGIFFLVITAVRGGDGFLYIYGVRVGGGKNPFKYVVVVPAMMFRG